MAIAIHFGGTPAIYDFLMLLAKMGNREAGRVAEHKFRGLPLKKPGIYMQTVVRC